VEAARAAIASQIAAPLGLQIEEAAEAILKLATAKMAGAIRLVSIEKGHDPAKFAAMPFGGGGGLHTGALIKEVGLGSALVPRFPGVTSALGCVVADMRHDRVQTVNRLLDQTDAAALGEEMAGVAADTGALLSASGISFERIDRVYELDMLYVGQTHTVSVEVHMPEGGLTREAIAARFDAAYREAYGRLLENIPRRVMNYRVSVIGRRRKLDMKVFAPVGGRPAPQCLLATRRIFADGIFMDAGVYDRLALETGASIMGPALLEQADSTVFVDPGLCARVDDFGNLVITPGGEHDGR
jgi:N-methylhydantoinase A